jgi:hypothetical protein
MPESHRRDKKERNAIVGGLPSAMNNRYQRWYYHIHDPPIDISDRYYRYQRSILSISAIDIIVDISAMIEDIVIGRY